MIEPLPNYDSYKLATPPYLDDGVPYDDEFSAEELEDLVEMDGDVECEQERQGYYDQPKGLEP